MSKLFLPNVNLASTFFKSLISFSKFLQDEHEDDVVEFSYDIHLEQLEFASIKLKFHFQV